MKIPQRNVEGWLDELIKQCEVSREERITRNRWSSSYYFQGSPSGDRAIYNRVRRHVNRMASYLYAAGSVRYAIEFDRTEGEPWLARANAAGRHLSREYRKHSLDIRFSQAVKQSLIRGKTFAKHLWGHAGPRLDVVWPEYMAVLREDLDSLAEQEAFVQTSWVTPDGLRAILSGRPDADQIVAEAERTASADDESQNDGFFHQVIMGGLQPVQTSAGSSNAGTVSPLSIPGAKLDPRVAASLIRFDEVWVVDDEREDYTTLQRAGPVLVEGRYKRRNLYGMKGIHPYVEVCSNPISGYFWGESEPEILSLLQDMLTKRVSDIKSILNVQGKPPKAFIGFTGMTQTKYNALMKRGGYISAETPNAKIEDLAPKLPEAAFTDVQEMVAMIDESGGFKPILQGEGESGVRAGNHAQTLLRTSSPELKERALIVERQAEDSGDLVFRLMQQHDAKVFVSDKKEQFLLAQLPEDWNVTVDSHSASPAFIEESKQDVILLVKSGAIGPVDAIRLLHPPMEDTLAAHAEEKQAAESRFYEEHPELLTKGKKK